MLKSFFVINYILLELLFLSNNHLFAHIDWYQVFLSNTNNFYKII